MVVSSAGAVAVRIDTLAVFKPRWSLYCLQEGRSRRPASSPVCWSDAMWP